MRKGGRGRGKREERGDEGGEEGREEGGEEGREERGGGRVYLRYVKQANMAEVVH